MRLKLSHALVLLLLLPVLLSVKAPGSEQPNLTHTFGLSLNTGVNNQIFTLFTVTMHGMSVVATQPMTREQFVLQAQGVVTSVANPDQENLFRKFKVEACLHPDSTKYYFDCPVLDDLWRLRFGEYPYHPMDGAHPGSGWAGKKSSPTPQQMVILADYGLMRLSDLIKGEDVFRLLRNLGDSTWVQDYRTGS